MVKKKYTFTLDPKLIAEIEKLDGTKSAIVGNAIQLYLHQNDKNQLDSSVPIPNFYTKTESDSKMDEVTSVMRDFLETVSTISTTQSSLKEMLQKNDDRLKSLEDRFNMKIVDFCKEYEQRLREMDLVADKLRRAKSPIPTP